MRLAWPLQTDWEADPVKLVPKKSLGKCLRAMESQTGGAQLPKSMCLTVCDGLI